MEQQDKVNIWCILATAFIMPLIWLVVGTATGSVQRYVEGYYFIGVWYYDYEAVIAYVSDIVLSYWWVIIICLSAHIFSLSRAFKMFKQTVRFSEEEILNREIREIVNSEME